MRETTFVVVVAVAGTELFRLFLFKLDWSSAMLCCCCCCRCCCLESVGMEEVYLRTSIVYGAVETKNRWAKEQPPLPLPTSSRFVHNNTDCMAAIVSHRLVNEPQALLRRCFSASTEATGAKLYPRTPHSVCHTTRSNTQNVRALHIHPNPEKENSRRKKGSGKKRQLFNQTGRVVMPYCR